MEVTSATVSALYDATAQAVVLASYTSGSERLILETLDSYFFS